MSGQTTQLIVPGFIRMKFVDKDGYLTDEAAKFFDNFVNQLQSYLGNGMYIVPQQTTANMAHFATQNFIGGIAYNSDTKTFQCNQDGAIKTITTS